MSERDDSLYLQHILDAVARVESYLKGVEEPEFYDSACYKMRSFDASRS